jgi:hypothetical protein
MTTDAERNSETSAYFKRLHDAIFQNDVIFEPVLRQVFYEKLEINLVN